MRRAVLSQSNLFICPGQAKGSERYNTSLHSVTDNWGYSREGLPCLVARVLCIHFLKLLLVLFPLSSVNSFLVLALDAKLERWMIHQRVVRTVRLDNWIKGTSLSPTTENEELFLW